MADRFARQASPRQALPLGGYLRLTVDRQGNKIGYEAQKNAIEAWARVTGETIGEWYQDKDLTAADLTVVRPEYERMLADIQAGHIGGIAVWRLDRLVRLTREFERVNAILEDANAYLLSIDPMLSTRDQMGKFVIRMIVMMAEMEIDSMRARAIEHHRQKARQGKYSGGGHRPFGFNQDGITHHLTEAALVREATRRLLDGESYTDIILDWDSRQPPVRGTRGLPFKTTTLQTVLESARIAGLREYKEPDPDTGQPVALQAPAEWQAIISEADWQRIKALRTTRTVGRPHEYLLSGLVVCGKCGARMYGSRQKNGQGASITMYRCTYRTNSNLDSCGKCIMHSDPVDQVAVEAVMQRIARTPEILDAVDAELSAEAAPAVQTSREIIRDCDDKLSEFATLAALPASKGGITRAEWMRFREAVLKERADAVRRLESYRSQRLVPVPLGRDRQDLRAWFDGLTMAQRRAFMAAHLAQAVIGPGTRPGRVDPSRVRVLFAEGQIPGGQGPQVRVRDRGADALLTAPLV